MWNIFSNHLFKQLGGVRFLFLRCSFDVNKHLTWCLILKQIFSSFLFLFGINITQTINKYFFRQWFGAFSYLIMVFEY